MVSRPKLADPGALIRTGWKPRTAEYRVCVDPELVEEYERARGARDAVAAEAADSLAGKTGATAAADAEVERLLEQVEANTVTLVVQSLPRPRFRAITDKYPPRKDADGKPTHPADALVGVDFDGCMAELIRASIASPQLDAETVDLLLDERLTDADYLNLAMTCWGLNKATVDVPFSSGGSRSRRVSSRK